MPRTLVARGRRRLAVGSRKPRRRRLLGQRLPFGERQRDRRVVRNRGGCRRAGQAGRRPDRYGPDDQRAARPHRWRRSIRGAAMRRAIVLSVTAVLVLATSWCAYTRRVSE